MRVLCCGGAGFIGSHLVDKLIAEGHRVLVLDDFSGGRVENINKDAKWQNIDLRQWIQTRNAFSQFKPELVYHLAANAAEGKSHFAPRDIVTRNYNTLLNVATAGIRYGMKRIVVTSSVAVYGSITPPFKESDTPHPEDLYGLSKLMMEETLRIMSQVHNFEYVIARAHNVYGPRQSMNDPYRNVIALWMNSILKGESYTIFGQGEMERCYTYVSDLVEGLYAMATADISKETFNLGADEHYSLRQLSDLVQEISGSQTPPQYLPTRPQETVLARLDHSKAKTILSYETKVGLKEGLVKMWEWAKAQGSQELIYGGIELPSDRMPANWKK